MQVPVCSAALGARVKPLSCAAGLGWEGRQQRGSLEQREINKG